MIVKIYPGKLHEKIPAIPSKSDLHRALICAALGTEPARILVPGRSPLSEDIEATERCLLALGAGIETAETEDGR